jgi:hypothetical protein
MDRKALETRVKAMEARVKTLEAVLDIENLKMKYWRSMDQKAWAQVGECFTADGRFEVPPRLKTDTGILTVLGSRAIAEFLGKRLVTAITVHQGLAPEIELISDTAARGTWQLHDVIVNEKENTILTGYGVYEDEYVKENGDWKIKSSKLSRKYVETRNRTTLERIS